MSKLRGVEEFCTEMKRWVGVLKIGQFSWTSYFEMIDLIDREIEWKLGILCQNTYFIWKLLRGNQNTILVYFTLWTVTAKWLIKIWSNFLFNFLFWTLLDICFFKFYFGLNRKWVLSFEWNGCVSFISRYGQSIWPS